MATVDDVALRWGHDPSDAESALIELRLADVERMILRKIPDIRLRIAAGDVHFEDVVQVEADAVVRLMRNPEGYISETDGDYSYQIAKELSTGRLAVLDDEWDALGWRKATMSILVPEPQVDGEWDDDTDFGAVPADSGSGILLVLSEADLPSDGDAKLACTTDSATLWIRNRASAVANAAGWVQVGAASKLPVGQQRGQLMSWNDVSQGWEPAKWTFTALAGATLVWSGTRQAWVASENRLQDASDVDAASRSGGGALATGDVLSYDAVSLRWVVKAPSDFLSQMVITSAAAGDVLTWDGVNWVNAGAYTKADIDAKLSGLASGLARKPAVQDISVVPPAAPSTGPNYIVGRGASGDWAGHDDEVTFWDGAAWVFSTATKGDTHTVLSSNTSMTWNGTDWVSVGSQASKLGELSDVTVGAVPSSNDALMWDGAGWVNQPVPPPPPGPVSAHTDVDTTGAVDTDRLAFDGVAGVWKPIAALDHTLDGLGDTALPSVLNAGDVVVWDAVAQKWTAKAPSGLSVALDGLLDVNAGVPVDGDILRWDAVAGQWINRVLPSTLDELSDVDVTGLLSYGEMLAWDGSMWSPVMLRLDTDALEDVSLLSPQNEDFLVFNGAEWENRPVPLGDLADLSVVSPADGEVLTYDGGVWINQAPAAVPQTLDALTDVDTSGVSSGQVLSFDGTGWVAAATPQTLDDLTDVDTSTASTGQVLSFDGTSWAPAATAQALGALTDVDTSTAADKNVLQWDDTAKLWKPVADLGYLKPAQAYSKPEVDAKLAALTTGMIHGESVNSITNTPPAPTVGDLFIVGTAPTGAWAGQANNLAYWDGAAWVFEAPQSGESHLVESLSETWHWSGTAWVKVAAAATGGASAVGDLWIVGSIQTSWLTETQFRAALGLNSSEDHKWCLCDGRNVTGSQFQTITGLANVPDLRGSYLRMAGQNSNSQPDWNGEALRGFQGWMTGRSRTTMTGVTNNTGSHNHQWGSEIAGSQRAAADYMIVDGWNIKRYTSDSGNHTHTVTINGGGDRETRPNSFSVNHFIKIN